MEKKVDRRRFLVDIPVGIFGASLVVLGVSDAAQMENQVKAELDLVSPRPTKVWRSTSSGKGPISYAVPGPEEELLIQKYGGDIRKLSQSTTIFTGIFSLAYLFYIRQRYSRGGSAR